MNFKLIWQDNRRLDEIEITSHPDNKAVVQLARQTITKFNNTILVKEPINDRQVKLSLNEIESISALGHLSKIQTTSGKEYYFQKRLKELEDWEKENFFRINKSMILNLTHVNSFSVGKQARLEVFIKSGQTHIVNRYYAKQIKERLL